MVSWESQGPTEGLNKYLYLVGVIYFIKLYKIIKLNEIIKRKIPTQMEEWELILEYIDKSDDLW